MNQTATWEKIGRYDLYPHFNYHFMHHHLWKTICRRGRFRGVFHHHWKTIYRVEIRIGQKTVEARGLYDTGNSLYEPIGHQPVSIIAASLAQTLLSEGQWQTRLRIIPYRSIGVNCGLMRGFVADELIVCSGRKPARRRRPVLAVANQSFGQEDGYQIILHPDLI